MLCGLWSVVFREFSNSSTVHNRIFICVMCTFEKQQKTLRLSELTLPG